MGRVITSPKARAEFAEDPSGFAAALGLDVDDANSLVAMSKDLTNLAPSFVLKRRRMLRGNARRTMDLLGERGNRLLTAYLVANPPRDRLQDEMCDFMDYVVERTAAIAGRNPDGPLIADMARYEALMVRARQTPRPLGERLPDSSNLQGFDILAGLRMAPGAGLGHFGWDLRAVRRFDPASITATPPDPCDLVIFQLPGSGQSRSIRLLPQAAIAVARIRDVPGTSAADASAELDRPARVIDTLARLRAQGALEWN